MIGFSREITREHLEDLPGSPLSETLNIEEFPASAREYTGDGISLMNK